MNVADVLGKWKCPGSHQFQSDEVETAMKLWLSEKDTDF
jgi:hypothetical protein